MSWQPLPLGAGGFVRGLDIHTDGTKVCRCDTYGAYIFSPSWLPSGKWVQLVRASAFPVGDPMADYSALNSSSPVASVANGLGVFCIRIAPSNSSRFYMLFGGYLYTSINKGQTWQATNYPADTTSVPNDQSSFGGFDFKIGIDPHNEQVVVVGTGAGIRYSTDAGNIWHTITTVATPTNNPGACCIEFDPSSWVSGDTPGIYIESYGHGVYHSSTGPGGTFTLTASGPTTARHMTCNADGTLFCISNVNSDPLYIYNAGGSGVWATTTYTGNGSTFGLYGAAQLAIDPSTSGATTRVVIVDGAGGVNVSTDRGATFAAGTAPVTGSTADIPWQGTVPGYLIAGCAFDPSQSNVLYAANGLGVLSGNPSNTGGGTIAWNDQSAGIEQLVVTSITSVPGGSVLVTCWDRPIFTLTNPRGTSYPSTFHLQSSNADQLAECYPAAYCPATPTFVAAIAEIRNRAVDSSGSSSDGGLTWTAFPTLPTDLVNFKTGGQLALVSPTNWVVFVGGDEEVHTTSGVWQTLNAGATWNDIAITGVTGGWNTNDDFSGTAFTTRKVVDVDAAGTIYAYNYGFSTGAAGVYTSSNGGSSFALAHSGRFDSSTQSFFGAHLRCVPGQGGNAFYASGLASDQPGNPAANTPFYRTTDNGVTWPPVSGVTNVAGFGFGAAATPGGYPTIFIHGCVGGSSIANYALWMSSDNAVSWSRVNGLTQAGATGGNIFPNDTMDGITCVEGDMNTFGVCYVGFLGSGAAFFAPDGGRSITGFSVVHGHARRHTKMIGY